MKSIAPLIGLVALLSSVPVSAQSSALVVRAKTVAAQGSVAIGAQRVPMLHLEMAAPCGTKTSLRSITVHHAGLGNPSDIAAVYAMQGNRRVTRSATVNAKSQEAILRFRDFSLKPCEKTSLTVMVNLSADAANGGQHSLSLEHAEDINAGTTPARLTTTPAFATASVAPVRQGTITVTYLNLPRRVEYGANRMVARLKLEADGEANHYIDAMTFTNNGKARDADLHNLYLDASRRQLGSSIIEKMDGALARFHFDMPLLLEKNSSLILELRADVRASRTKTIQFEIEEPSDIEARSVRGRIR